MELDVVAPPGWEKSIKKMKQNKDIDNPFALAWYMRKRNYKPHREDADSDSLFDAVLLAALTEVQSSGLPLLCTQAAAGDVNACARMLDAAAGPWVQERRW